MLADSGAMVQTHLAWRRDPGAPAIGFQVRDLDAASALMKSSGGSIITTGDGKMVSPGGGAVAFTRDPNGILVELTQAARKK
jgi:predicted enzyme related to lactoylglutathione lyase